MVTWKSKKNVVVSFNVKVELSSNAQGICELSWLKIILEDLKIKWDGPMKLYCDNKSTINMAYNLVQHESVKHVEMDKHFIKEKKKSLFFFIDILLLIFRSP